jgi:NO-binding membrane sensor protein with MHYT domain
MEPTATGRGRESRSSVITQVAYGLAAPILAFLMSTTGTVLGLLLAARARTHAYPLRQRMQFGAALGIGGIGLWLAHEIEMLGYAGLGPTIRFSPLWTLLGLAVSVAGPGAALVLAGGDSSPWWRRGLSWPVLGTGFTATEWCGLASLRTGAIATYHRPLLAATAGVALALGLAVLWFTFRVRQLWVTAIGAPLLSAGIAVLDHLAAAAVRLRPDTVHYGVSGLSVTALLAPILLVGTTVTAMLGYFAFGRATVRDLRGIYIPSAVASDIEPWMIDAVTARVHMRQPARRDPVRLAGPANVGPRTPAARPTPGGLSSWRGVPVWGPDPVAVAPALAAPMPETSAQATPAPAASGPEAVGPATRNARRFRSSPTAADAGSTVERHAYRRGRNRFREGR